MFISVNCLQPVQEFVIVWSPVLSPLLFSMGFVTFLTPDEGCQSRFSSCVLFYWRVAEATPLLVPCPWRWSLFIPFGHVTCPRGGSPGNFSFMFPAPGESQWDCFSLGLFLGRNSPHNRSLLLCCKNLNFSLTLFCFFWFCCFSRSPLTRTLLSNTETEICRFGKGYFGDCVVLCCFPLFFLFCFLVVPCQSYQLHIIHNCFHFCVYPQSK